MNVVSEGLGEQETDGGSLLNEFIEAGDFDDADYLPPNEAPEEAAQAAEDADQPETDDETDDDTETEVKADDADTEDEGDYVEIDAEDGTTERVALNDLLDARKTLMELGTDAEQIRHNIAEQATTRVKEQFTALDQQINQTVELYATLSQLMPQVQPPDQSMLDEYSRDYNPALYRQQMQAYEQVNQIMEGAKGKMQELNEQYKAEQSKAQDLQKQQDWAQLTSLDKSWLQGDAEKRLNTLRKSTVDAYGLDAGMVGTITTPGFIRMAEDAMKYREAKAKGVKPKAKSAPRLVKGNAGGKGKSQDGARKARAAAHLKKTGEVSNLEDVWGEFLS